MIRVVGIDLLRKKVPSLQTNLGRLQATVRESVVETSNLYVRLRFQQLRLTFSLIRCIRHVNLHVPSQGAKEFISSTALASLGS